jgi:adenylate kinase
MKLIILGAQASGKGTQSEMLAKELGIEHISTGERLRQEVASGSVLGKKMGELMKQGAMVPDELVEKMVKRLIEQSHGKFVLDGFPRTKAQAEWLDLTTTIDKVIVLKISDKVALERIGGRLECAKGHDFHIKFNPPKKEGTCDECGLPLKKRADDTAAAIMKRLQIYHTQTEPVLSHYKGKIIEVNGEQSIKDVHFAVLKALHTRV